MLRRLLYDDLKRPGEEGIVEYFKVSAKNLLAGTAKTM
jgi:hypothetical protein